MLEQSKHEPSMQYARDIYKVASKLKDFTALEIGAAWGFSTLAILEASAKHLTTVDPNLNIKAPAEVEANEYKDKWAWDCVHSAKFWEGKGDNFDLIYIDGSHLYKDIKNDLYNAWQRLNPNGLMLVDDWDHPKNNTVDKNGAFAEYGVSLACWEFARDYKWTKLGIEGRVLWFKK